MALVKQSTGNYARSVHYGVVTGGYFTSVTGTPPAAGNAAGAALAKLDLVKNFPFAVVDPDTPQQKGDGGAGVRFINKPTDLPESDITFGTGDLTFQALVQSMKVVAKGHIAMTPGQPYNPQFRDVCFLVQSPSKVRDGSADQNAEIWEGYLILKTNVYPRFRDGFDSESLPTYQYKLVGNYATQAPWGEAFSTGVWGDTEMVFIPFIAPYPMMLQTWVLDGSETVFDLAHQLADNSADVLHVWRNGTALTWVAETPGALEFEASPVTNNITLGAEGTDGDLLHAFYACTGG